MRDYIVYGDCNSKDYGIYAANVNMFDAPKRDVELIRVPGLNGTLTIDNGRYQNVSIKYRLYLKGQIHQNIRAFVNRMVSSGYKRLEDTFNPDTFYMARYVSGLSVGLSDRNSAAFDVEFDRKPQRYLKSGEQSTELTAAGSINNQTEQTALPLLRVYGDGTLTIGSISITIAGSDTYTDIDCELMEAYKDTLATNKNSTITLTNGEFPKLLPGANAISFTGITKVIITPRWWIL